MSTEAFAGDPTAQSVGPSTVDRLVAAVAWVVWFGALVTSLLGMAAGIASQSTPNPTLPQSAASIVAAAAIALTYASVGLLLRLRRPRIVIGWLFLGIGLVSGFGAILWNYVWLSDSLGVPPGPISGIQAAMLNEVLVVPGWAVLLVMLILLFPDGRLVDRAWRPVMGLAIAVSVVFAIALGLNPGPLLFFPIYDNPIAPAGLGGDLMTAITSLTTIAIVILGAAAVWSVVVRYRRSDIHGRHQLKWLAWGSSLAVVGGVILLTVASRSFDPRTNAADVSWLIFAAGSIALPIAALIAILREGLYDIDQIIGRTFVFGVLTAILAGVYTASIRLFNALFVGMTGQSNELALVLTTLILATTFTPIKLRLEQVARKRLGTSAAGATAATTDVPASEVPALPDQPPAEPSSSEDEKLDRRIEAIARRVSLEVLAGSARTEGATQDDRPDQDQDERPEQVTEAGKPGPQP
jgi:hypothetical protein